MKRRSMSRTWVGMLNRPRPRKIVTVVRSEDPKPEPTPAEVSYEPINEILNVEKTSLQISQDSMEQAPIQTQPRRPVVASAKKAFVPPPPSFSEVRSPNSSKGTSPVSSPKKNSNELPRSSDGFNKIAVSFIEDLQRQVSPPATTPLSPKSSGEKILDAADKAADFIGDALRGTFKKLSVADDNEHEPIKFASPKDEPQDDPFADIMSKLKQPEPDVVRARVDDKPEPEQSFQELLSSPIINEDVVAEPVVKIKTPTLASPKKQLGSPVNSPDSITSSYSGSSFGFRANILKHGLNALEKIGKTTADVVVNTRNKMTDVASPEFIEALPPRPFNPVTPDYHDAKSSFLETFQLYSGLTRLTDLQMQSIKSSISMKLAKAKSAKQPRKSTTFDYNARMHSAARIAKNLHQDRILEILQNPPSDCLLLLSDAEFLTSLRSLKSCFELTRDDFDCMRRLLRSLDQIFIDGSAGEDIVSRNKRRHILCQISALWCEILKVLLSHSQSELDALSCDICTLTGHIALGLQNNFECSCTNSESALRDQNECVKLLLDISYTSVPILQSLLLSSQ